MGGGDDEDIPDSGLHEGGDGIVDHRFVEDGEQLFAHSLRDGVETGTGTSGEDDAFHGICKEGGRLEPLCGEREGYRGIRERRKSVVMLSIVLFDNPIPDSNGGYRSGWYGRGETAARTGFATVGAVGWHLPSVKGGCGAW